MPKKPPNRNEVTREGPFYKVSVYNEGLAVSVIHLSDVQLAIDQLEALSRINELPSFANIHKWLKCDDCGTVSEDVTETNCPYDKDINNRNTPCILCSYCYNIRVDDI